MFKYKQASCLPPRGSGHNLEVDAITGRAAMRAIAAGRIQGAQRALAVARRYEASGSTAG